jgi:hypothetical protein
VFAVLCEALSRVDGTVLDELDEERDSLLCREGGGSEAGPRESDMTAGSGQVTVKMDDKAFIRAAEIDDVLLQAIWRRCGSSIS